MDTCFDLEGEGYEYYEIEIEDAKTEMIHLLGEYHYYRTRIKKLATKKLQLQMKIINETKDQQFGEVKFLTEQLGIVSDKLTEAEDLANECYLELLENDWLD